MSDIRFRLRLALAVVPLVAAVAAGCTRTAAQPAPQGPPQVSVATVIDREVTEWDEFTGRLEPVESVDVRPRVSGYVSSVRFTEGAIVRKGDPLFQIDDRPFLAEVDRLRAENAMSLEEHDRRSAFAQEAAAQVAAV